MDTDATRRYRLPTHLSMKLPQYRQYFNPPSLAAPLRDIPDPHDLFNIKEDLENIASEPETRTQRLQRDLAHLLENVKVLETPPGKKIIEAAYHIVDNMLIRCILVCMNRTKAKTSNRWQEYGGCHGKNA